MDVNDMLAADDYFKRIGCNYPDDGFWNIFEELLKSTSQSVRRNLITNIYTLSVCIYYYYYIIVYRDFNKEVEFNNKLLKYTEIALNDSDIEVRNNCLDLIFSISASYNEKGIKDLIQKNKKEFNKLQKNKNKKDVEWINKMHGNIISLCGILYLNITEIDENNSNILEILFEATSYPSPIKDIATKWITAYKTANQENWSRCSEVFSEDLLCEFEDSSAGHSYFS